MEPQNETDKRILTIRKTFNVPVATVWEAWTDPQHIAEWWAPPGMQVRIVKHEFKVGGQWQFTMPMPDGSEFISEGVYSKIVEHKEIETTADMKPMTEGVTLRILFEADGDSTHFTFSVIHPTEAYCRQQEQMGFYNGWGTAFKRLESVLESRR